MTQIQKIGDKYARQISRGFQDWRDAYTAGVSTGRTIHITPFDPTSYIKGAFYEAEKAQSKEIIKLALKANNDALQAVRNAISVAGPNPNSSERGSLVAEHKRIAEEGDRLKKEWLAIGSKSGESQLSELVKGPGTGFAFDLRSPEAEAWIRDYAASEIKYINAATRQTIQKITLRAFQEGLTPQQQSKLIRQYIGLLPQHVTAVENYRNALGDIDSSLADKMEERYIKKLIKWRADTIALTESHTASNEGNRESTRQAVERGVLGSDEYEMELFNHEDDRICPICNDLRGKRCPLPGGIYGGRSGPPFHPRCRDTEVVVKK